MKRYLGLIIVAVAVAAAGYYVWLNYQEAANAGQADAGVVDFVEPEVTEFTPAGWAKFKADVAAAVAGFPPDSAFRKKDITPELWVRKADQQKKLAEAYAAVDPDSRKVVFQKVADNLLGRRGGPDDALAKLVEAYERDHPGDGWGKFYLGQQKMRRGDAAGAEPLFAAAAAALPGEERVRSAWSGCLMRLKKWKEAYEATEKRQEDFLRTAFAAYQAEDAAALEALCDHRKATVPTDPESEYYRGWVHWLRKDYPAANRTWDAYLAGGGEQQIPPVEYDRPFRARFRANRLADARAFVEHTPKAAKPSDVLIWKAMLAAKDGKPEEVIKALDALKAEVPDFVWANDRDLGPLLKAPAMAPVREKYPPPAGA